MDEAMRLSDEAIIAIRKSIRNADITKPFADTIAFARAIESASYEHGQADMRTIVRCLAIKTAPADRDGPELSVCNLCGTVWGPYAERTTEWHRDDDCAAAIRALGK